MPERNKWVPMNGRANSRNFGIYREADKAGTKPATKILLVLACLAAVVLIICFTTLSISKSKGKKRIESVLVRRQQNVGENNKDLVMIGNSTEVSNVVAETTERNELTEDDTIQRPEVADNRIKFPDVKENGGSEYLETEGQLASRIGRAMGEEQWNNRNRVVNRPVYPDNVVSPPIYYTPVPSYSEQYAQLEGYRNPTRVKSVQDVMGYVNDRRPTLPTIPQPPAPTVKFTGIYIRAPVDDEEYDEEEEYPAHIPYGKPSFNGHAYVSDPFKPFKPAHPSEINHLATFPSEFDTGPRFSNKIIRPTKVTISEPIASPSSGTLTQAIFHPLDQTPPNISKLPERKQRPLKIMLDIYPVSSEIEIGHPPVETTRKPRLRPQPTTPPQSNRMIVHLNLYPKKIYKPKRQPLLTSPLITSLVPGGGNFEDRMFGTATGLEESGEVYKDSDHPIELTGDGYETTGGDYAERTDQGNTGQGATGESIGRENGESHPRLGIGETPSKGDSAEIHSAAFDGFSDDYVLEGVGHAYAASVAEQLQHNFTEITPSNNSHTPVL